MRNTYMQQANSVPIWATPLVAALLWTAVVVLAIAGIAMLTVHGDTGVLLFVAALVVAAPAAAASRLRSYL
ncbi:hypothetical protein [Microbacterium testaceum]|uniref:hypothetical protein n=1 Tax=Microbacterium testaceum TaxID=2033 RepID=UPI00124589CB|nr:hypothetical protein [Microbacterium testaceum]